MAGKHEIERFADYVWTWAKESGKDNLFKGVFDMRTAISKLVDMASCSGEMSHEDYKAQEAAIADAYIAFVIIARSRGCSMSMALDHARHKMLINNERKFRRDGSSEFTEDQINELPF